MYPPFDGKLHQANSNSAHRGLADSPTHGRVELDSHADTIVLGSNFIVMSFTGRECDVLPYSDTYEPIPNVPIVSGATAWTSPDTAETYILIFNEALWMGDSLYHLLLNPNQMRHSGIVVQDNPYEDTLMHLMTADHELAIPLSSDGTTIYANTRTPTT